MASSYYDYFIGVSIAILSSVILNLGILMQKKAHNTFFSLSKEDRFKRKSIVRSPIWITGFFVFALGNLGNVVALAFAAASVITPMGAFSLVSNAIFAPILLGERFYRTDAVGTLFIIVGATLAVISGPKQEKEFTLADLLVNYQKLPFVIYICILISMIAATFSTVKWAEHRLIEYGGVQSTHPSAGRWRRLLPVGYTGMGGILGSQTILTAKSSLELVRSTVLSGDNQFVHLFPWILVATFCFTAIAQIQWINSALRHFEALIVNPMYFVIWTIFSIIGANMYFDEFSGITAVEIVMFLSGVVIALMGVYVLAQHPPSHGEDFLEYETSSVGMFVVLNSLLSYSYTADSSISMATATSAGSFDLPRPPSLASPSKTRKRMDRIRRAVLNRMNRRKNEEPAPPPPKPAQTVELSTVVIDSSRSRAYTAGRVMGRGVASPGSKSPEPGV